MAADAVIVVVLALAIDLAFGDPPNRWHPVAWMGAALASGRRVLGRGSPAWLVVAGGGLVVAVAAVAGVIAAAVSGLSARLGVAGFVVEAVALSTLLSARGLVRAARAVDAALARDDVVGARAMVSFHLVSRDTRGLDEAHVTSATVESLAENVGDSVVAPLCGYLAFGLAGAAIYRTVNTADALLGYREAVLQHFGKVAARLDDVLNLIPARLSGLAIVVAAAGLPGADGRGAWRVMWRDARNTASPNAGWPMAAIAGALGVSLEKRGTYRLGDGPLPRREAIERAIRLVGVAIAIAAGTLALARLTLSQGA